MDHFENLEELIKTCKMWIRDDDIDAYYRFFEFNCMKALVTAYEKEKEKNKELEDKIKATIEEVEQWELYNMKIPKLSTLEERLGAKIGIKYVLQSLLKKE